MHSAENYWFIWFFCLWMFWHRFDVGTMLHVFELNVKNPTFAKQKNSSNAKGFLLRTKLTCIQVACKFDDKTIRINSFKPPHTVKALVLNTF